MQLTYQVPFYLGHCQTSESLKMYVFTIIIMQPAKVKFNRFFFRERELTYSPEKVSHETTS